MINKVYFLLLLLFAIISAKEEYQIVELKENDERDIVLTSTVLYIITKTEKSGFLAHYLTVSESMGNLKESIFYNVSDSSSIEDKNFVKPDGASITETVSNKLKEYVVAFQIEQNKYGITKFTNLKTGETVTTKAYYFTKTAAYVTIIIVILVILCVICLICWIIKKCCC